MIERIPKFSGSRSLEEPDKRLWMRQSIIVSVLILSGLVGQKPSIPILISISVVFWGVLFLHWFNSQNLIKVKPMKQKQLEEPVLFNVGVNPFATTKSHIHHSGKTSPDFWNVEKLQNIIHREGGPLLLNVTGCTVEFVQDPTTGVKCGFWAPVLSFEGVKSRLVIDKSVARTLTRISRSHHLPAWGRVGQIMLDVQTVNGKARVQISTPEIRPNSFLRPSRVREFAS